MIGGAAQAYDDTYYTELVDSFENGVRSEIEVMLPAAERNIVQDVKLTLIFSPFLPSLAVTRDRPRKFLSLWVF